MEKWIALSLILLGISLMGGVSFGTSPLCASQLREMVGAIFGVNMVMVGVMWFFLLAFLIP